MANITGYVSKKLVANVAEQSISLDVNKFYLIKNISANVITVNLDNATTEDNAIELEAGEFMENFDQYCKVLYYKASVNASILKVIAKREKSY